MPVKTAIGTPGEDPKRKQWSTDSKKENNYSTSDYKKKVKTKSSGPGENPPKKKLPADYNKTKKEDTQFSSKNGKKADRNERLSNVGDNPPKYKISKLKEKKMEDLKPKSPESKKKK